MQSYEWTMSHGIMNGLFVQAAGAIASGLLGYIGGLETRAVVTHPGQRKFLNREETKLREKWLQGINNLPDSVSHLINESGKSHIIDQISEFIGHLTRYIATLEMVLYYYEVDPEEFKKYFWISADLNLQNCKIYLAEEENPFTSDFENHENQIYENGYEHAKAYLNLLIEKYNDILPEIAKRQAVNNQEHTLPLLE